MSKLNFENINQDEINIESKIVVIDAICGKGKTQYALERIVRTNEKFIYVTPYLAEIIRVKDWCKEHGIKVQEPKYLTPDHKNLHKLRREREVITKAEHFKQLVM